MPNSLNLTVIYLIVAIIVSSVIGFYGWRNPQTRGSRAFAIACSSAIFWMLGDVIGRLNNTFTGQWIGEIVRYVGVEILPVALLVFIYQYCGKEISNRRIKWLMVIPVISWFVMVTNPWHNLFFSSMSIGVKNSMKLEYGAYFWFVHLPYNYSLILTGFMTILMEFSRASRHYRTQILVLFFSLSIPFFVNLIGVFRIFGEFSYTALSFPIFFLIMGFAIYHYQFLGSNPIAYETVFQTIRDGVVILDSLNIIRDINPVAAKSLNKTPQEVVGLNLKQAFHDWGKWVEQYENEPDFYQEIELNVNGSTQYISITITLLESNTETIVGKVLTIRDITDRRQYQQSLETLAFHDPLTRLANRRKFQEEVERATVKANDSGETFAILYFDLDRFKSVNDSLGHDVGDELLKYVAARVASILRKPDVLARLGGDEFAILLHNCNEKGVDLVVKRMLDNVQRPFKVADNTLIAELSIGAAFYPKDGRDLTQLLRHADIAMYQAKQNGGGLSLHNYQIDSVANLEM